MLKFAEVSLLFFLALPSIFYLSTLFYFSMNNEGAFDHKTVLICTSIFFYMRIKHWFFHLIMSLFFFSFWIIHIIHKRK